MIYDLKKYVKYLCDRDISPDQYLLCLMVYKKDIASIKQYLDSKGKLDSAMIDDLIVKGYIEDFSLTKDEHDELIKMLGDSVSSSFRISHQYNLKNLLITPKFTEGVLIDNNMAAQEFWDSYPKSVKFANSPEVSARTRTVYKNREELFSTYGKKIKNNLELHLKILNTISENYPIYAEMGIDKFVDSDHWELLFDKKNPLSNARFK
jgi:hypothetical protein